MITIRIGSVKRKYRGARTGGCTLVEPRKTSESFSCLKLVMDCIELSKVVYGCSCLSIPNLWDQRETMMSRGNRKPEKKALSRIHDVHSSTTIQQMLVRVRGTQKVKEHLELKVHAVSTQPPKHSTDCTCTKRNVRGRTGHTVHTYKQQVAVRMSFHDLGRRHITLPSDACLL